MSRICTFTGNRPNKLPWGYDESDLRCVAVKQKIADLVLECVLQGFDYFVCGMAEGGDTYFAEAVLALKNDIQSGKINFAEERKKLLAFKPRQLDLFETEANLPENQPVSEIKLECAIPFDGQAERWGAVQRARYEEIVAKADVVHILATHYSPWCMHARNRYMVDKSERVLALDYGEKGGTSSTINYAKKCGKEVIFI